MPLSLASGNQIFAQSTSCVLSFFMTTKVTRWSCSVGGHEPAVVSHSPHPHEPPMRREERHASSGVKHTKWRHHDDRHWDEQHVDSYDTEPSVDEELLSEIGLSADALDAHRQVLEMANTIETLTRDFENQQQELFVAYRRLKELSGREQTSPTNHHAGDNLAKLSRRGCGEEDDDIDGCCSHQGELYELRKLVDVKDTALIEALQQRNEYRIELERAETVIRELRSMHMDGGGGTGASRQAWRVHPTVSTMGAYHASGIAMPCTQASLAPGYASNSSGSSATAMMMLGGNGAIEVPRNERFDHESTYQRKENDELFWRKQYKEAVRMRKKYGLVNPAGGNTGGNNSNHGAGHQHGSGSHGTARPSLKIFSYPDNRRQKGIKDENVPFSRYIGISARQHEIIKEQHRMLA